MTSVVDPFTRTSGSAPDLGAARGQWVALAGTWGILNQAAYVSSGTASSICLAAVSTGVADCTVSTTIATANGATIAGLCLRATDGGNCYVVEVQKGAAEPARIYKLVSGTATAIATSAADVEFAVGDVIKATVSGSTITVYLNDVQIVAVTDTTYPTQTLHGLYTVAPTGTPSNVSFDSFLVTA